MSKTAQTPAKPSQGVAAPATIEQIRAKIALTGNLAGLTDPERWEYYQQYCAYLGLDPITRPFDLITTYEAGPAGERIEKTILYANASCSAQLAEKRGITFGRPEMLYDAELGVLSINVKAEYVAADNPRSCWRRGVAHVAGLKGRTLENAIKKAETQAHRRVTLALCGVSMPDESEIEDIPGAQTLTSDDALGGDYDYIGQLIKAAGEEDSSGERRFIYAWLTQGAFQSVAQRLKQPVEAIARRFKHLAKTSAPVLPTSDPNSPDDYDVGPGDRGDTPPSEQEMAERIRQARETNIPAPAQTENKPAPLRPPNPPPAKSGPIKRAYGPEIAKRLDAACERLTARGVKGSELLHEVNATLIKHNMPEVKTRYELTDQTGEIVCQFFENWLDSIERRALEAMAE